MKKEDCLQYTEFEDYIDGHKVIVKKYLPKVNYGHKWNVFNATRKPTVEIKEKIDAKRNVE